MILREMCAFSSLLRLSGQMWAAQCKSLAVAQVVRIVFSKYSIVLKYVCRLAYVLFLPEKGDQCSCVGDWTHGLLIM